MQSLCTGDITKSLPKDLCALSSHWFPFPLLHSLLYSTKKKDVSVDPTWRNSISSQPLAWEVAQLPLSTLPLCPSMTTGAHAQTLALIPSRARLVIAQFLSQLIFKLFYRLSSAVHPSVHHYCPVSRELNQLWSVHLLSSSNWCCWLASRWSVALPDDTENQMHTWIPRPYADSANTFFHHKMVECRKLLKY